MFELILHALEQNSKSDICKNNFGKDKDSTRTECLSLRVTKLTLSLGEEFFELNGKLSQHAISAICVENESSLSKECVHEENASARPTLIVHRSNTGANRYLVEANELEVSYLKPKPSKPTFVSLVGLSFRYKTYDL